MYNRYIPQPDGSHRRKLVPDQARHQEPRRPPTPEQPVYEPEPCELPPPPPPRRKPCPARQDGSVLGFLKNLLPKDFDTGDLLIVLLLLLMAGDCAEDQNSALLTLVLYLFM